MEGWLPTRLVDRDFVAERVSNSVGRAAEPYSGEIVYKWLSSEISPSDRGPGSGGQSGETGRQERESRNDGAASTSPHSALTLTASIELEDRAGDVVLASGWELGAFRDNPVVLWAHDYGRPAIGRAINVWVEADTLKAEIEFAHTPFAREIASLYSGGFMRGISVGFRTLESARRTAGNGRPGILFKRQELLEISAAPVPLNPRALAESGPQANGGGVHAEHDERSPASPNRRAGEGAPPMGALSEGELDVLRQIRDMWTGLAHLLS